MNTDFNFFDYDSFVKKSSVEYITNNLSKKEFKELKRNIKSNSFYPKYIIRVNENDSEITKNNKLIQEKKQNPDKELFLKRYYEILKNQFKISNEIDLLPTMIKHIDKCPFCRTNQFVLTHDYSLKSCQSITISFKCLKYNEILYSQNLRPFTFDISFEFNERIKILMDRYVEEYPNNSEELLSKINEEFENTKVTSLLDKKCFLSSDFFNNIF